MNTYIKIRSKLQKNIVFKRSKGIWIGFLSCLILTIFLGLAPISIKYENPNMIKQEFENIYQYMQPQQFKIFTTTPVAINLQENEIVLVSSTTKNLTTKIGNVLYFIQLSTK